MSAYLKCLIQTYSLPLTILLCAGLNCTAVMASDSYDPFSTEANLSQPLLQPCTSLQIESTLNLLSVVNIALCKNPGTHETWANTRAQAAQVGINVANYLPNLNLNATDTHNLPGNIQRTVNLSMSYLLYDFGARAANLESAKQLLLSVLAAHDSAIQALFLATVQAFYQVHATQAALDASIVSEHAAQASFSAANAKYLAGSTTPADKLVAKTAYSQAILNRITAYGAMKISRGVLANLLGLDADHNLVLSDVSTFQQKGDLLKPQTEIFQNLEQNIAQLIETARKTRPDLQAAEATLNSAKALADAARATGKPTISLNALNTASKSGGINTQGASLGMSLSVPLFSGYAPTYRIRAAEAQIDAKTAQRDKLRLQVALDVWNACQNLNTAAQNLSATEDLLFSAEQSELVALGRYRAGVGIMLDLLNAQSVLASARQQRIQAVLNWNITRVILAQTMGNLNAAFLKSFALAN